MLKHLSSLASVVLLASLSSCAITDPEFKTLAATAEINPRPDAIVGMWHAKNSYMASDMADSLLFKSDGTFAWRLANEVIGKKNVHTDMQSWHYEGNGIWTVRRRGGWSSSSMATERYRISQGKLLREFKGGFGNPVQRILVRVN